MPYQVAIRKNATGEVRIYTDPTDWDDDYYIWEEGNWSCDSNLHRFFAWAADEEPEELDQHYCHEGMYDVLYIELPDGKRVSLQERDGQ
jgi:hypothetical protein